MAYGYIVWDSTGTLIINDSRVDMNLRQYPSFQVVLDIDESTNVTVQGVVSQLDVENNWLWDIQIVGFNPSDFSSDTFESPTVSYVSANTVNLADNRVLPDDNSGNLTYNITPYFVNKDL
jgi:hypothetical protein